MVRMQIEVAILPRETTRLPGRFAVQSSPTRCVPPTDEIAPVFGESAVEQGLERPGLAHATISCAAVAMSAFMLRLGDHAVAPSDKVVMAAARETM